VSETNLIIKYCINSLFYFIKELHKYSRDYTKIDFVDVVYVWDIYLHWNSEDIERKMSWILINNYLSINVTFIYG